MNFKHLHYFWVTAKAGGIVRAGEQMHTTPQTLSGQIKLLEERLGRAVPQERPRAGAHRRRPRGAGLRRADLRAGRRTGGRHAPGPRRRQRCWNSASAWPIRCAKSVAYRLLEPALPVAEPVRLDLPRRQVPRPAGAAGAAPAGPGDRRRADGPAHQRQGLQPRAGQQPHELLLRAGAQAPAAGRVSRSA